jgi:MPBQ/MSBQ methyltransferase
MPRRPTKITARLALAGLSPHCREYFAVIPVALVWGSGAAGLGGKQMELQEKYRRWFDGGPQSEGRGYCNFGYWTESTAGGEQGDHLVDRLLEFLPDRRKRAILDVACGQGGTTRRLARHFPQAEITGINLFPDQIEYAKKLAPGCTFLQMNATELRFPQDAFDLILCVEAAFHFRSRADFLNESWRVLEPGSHLLMSDILVNRPGADIPSANVVSLAEYRDRLAAAGFVDTTIVSCRDQTWSQFRRHSIRAALRAWRWHAAIKTARHLRRWDRLFSDYILVFAGKPKR